jgi:chromate reductase
MPTLSILAISGSLRSASYNTAVLQAAAMIAPLGMQVRIFDGLAALPPFNADHDVQPPVLVQKWRHQLVMSDGLLIASPEYAHGVSGSLKNALDWVVGVERFGGMPIGVVNTSPHAHFANRALKETLLTMAAQIIESASFSIPLQGSGLNSAGILQRQDMVATIRTAVHALRVPAMARRIARDGLAGMSGI